MTAAAFSPLEPPGGERQVLLHCCCAPCSGGILELMVATGIRCTVFFYNPNIHPAEEYGRRKDALADFARRLAIPMVDGDYEPARWRERIAGLEAEPERGRRCDACFDLRMEKTAAHAAENGFKVFSSTLGLSRWKDFDQVTRAGDRAAARHPGLAYWGYNWRKKGGSQRAGDVARRERFYMQRSCGCEFSTSKS